MSNCLQRSKKARLSVVLALLAGLEALAHDSAAGPTPGAGRAQPAAAASGALRVPKLFTAESMTTVSGRIARSTRDHPGPVRLEVSRAGAAPLSVLVAPNELLDALGLSLRPGEPIEVTGSLAMTQNPILVAMSFTVDGKQIRVRDEQGNVLGLPVAAPTPASHAARAKPAAPPSSTAR